MNGHDDFDRNLAEWFEADALSPTPAGDLDRVLAATGRRRPRPEWLAGLGSHWVSVASGTGSDSGVRVIPGLGLRPSTALILLLVIAALVGGAIMAGAQRFQALPASTVKLGHLAYGLDGDIYVADWDGKNAIRIADGVSPERDESIPCGTIWGQGSMWSPDGQYLAYRSNHNGGPCPGTVHVADADGQPVASFPGDGWYVRWSPDSSRVATWVDSSGPSRTIGIYGVDGVRQALLTLPPGYGPPGDYDPRWSPDGRSLLLRLDGGSTIGVYEIPIDGGAPNRVAAHDPRSHWQIGYSLDGARVAFVEDGSLVVARANGAEIRVLASGLERSMEGPLWSPNGDRIAFSWTDFASTYELRVLDLASGAVTSLATVYAPDPRPFRPITFSPEGDRILFAEPDISTGVDDTDQLWTVNADGSNARLLVAGTSWGDWQWQAESP